MGKGQSNCGREALVLSSSRLSLWLSCQSLEELEAGLRKASSYPEEVLILRRIKDLKNGDPTSCRLEGQQIDEQLVGDLKSNPGYIRAIFMEDSLFKDNLLYAEYKCERQAELMNAKRFTALHQVLSNFNANEKGKLRKQLNACTSTPLTFKGDTFTEQELTEHIKKHGPDIWQLKEQGKPELFDQLKNHCLAQTDGVFQMHHWYDTDYQFNAFADIPTGKSERELIEKLLEEGAEVAENQLEVPEYESWAHIEPGKRFSINDGAKAIHYVPHYSVGTREVTVYEHQAEFMPSAEDINTLQEELNRRFSLRRLRAEDILIIEREENGKKGKPWLKPWFHVPAKYRDQILEAAESGEPHEVDKGDRKWKEHVRRATPEDLKAFDNLYKPVEGGRYMWHSRYKEYAPQQEAIDKLKELKEPIKVSWESGEGAVPIKPLKDEEIGPDLAKQIANNLQAKNSKASHEAYASLEGAISGELVKLGLPGDLAKQLTGRDGKLKNSVRHQHHSETRREPIPHNAPFSERGILRFENYTPEEATEKALALGVAKAVAPEVPYNLIYRGRHRLGRVLPQEQNYAKAEAKLIMPEGFMVLHGMTGVSDADTAYKRLNTIFETGGLKSIAERRRMNITSAAQTLSPRGDIASGIDTGVPCKIGTVPSFGSYVFFGMKPEVLKRRDLWFSDTDFGAGFDRYDSYNSYAQQIGQGKLHQTAPPSARQHHLNNGAHNHQNECYLKYEIPWDEVDSIFVANHEGLDQKVRSRVEELKKKGKLPRDLKVITSRDAPETDYESEDYGDLPDQIYKRAEELNSTL